MPSRRRLAAYLAAGALLAVTGAAGVLIVGVTQTGTGREYVRRQLVDAITPRLRGRLYVGRIGGNVFTGVTVDSLELRGPDDSLFVAVGRVTLHYSPRDLWDRRVVLERVELDRPTVRLHQSERGEWNFRRVFRPRSPRAPRTGPGFGDYVVADSVHVRGGRIVLTMPWHPADSLRGARRDSAVAYNLAQRARGGAEIRRAGRYFTRTWRWSDLELASPFVRLADPDSAGRRFAIGRLDVNESDPPFRWRNLRGEVFVQGDTVWADVPHWDLAASTGRARAKVVWGSALPVRYDVHVWGDSVRLADVAWVYPTLPRTGGGRLELDIRNRPTNLRVIEYALSRMDVRTTRSRLLGAMTFAVGAPVLEVTDLDVEARPVNFDLVRALAGGPFAYDFQGDLTGTVKGPGGPLNRFQVADARVAFADAKVPGAVSRARARGGLDILRPANTKFRAFDVDAERVELRTIRALNPVFPALGGVVSGRARLDSSYLDLRFRDAVLTHTDGPAAPTTVAGAGRVTFGTRATAYDLTLGARPLSFTTLARSYPALPVRGTFAGPLRVRGATDDLALTTRLVGAAGTLAFDGRVNARGPVYAARGTYALESVDPRALVAGGRLPAGVVTARGTTDLRLSGFADLVGALTADLAPSSFGGLRVDAGALRARAEGGRLVVDSLVVDGPAGRLRAAGALGLTAAPAAAGDTLRAEVRIDSLGGLRGVLAARAAAASPAPEAERRAGADPVARVVARTTAQPVGQALARTLARAAVDTGAGARGRAPNAPAAGAGVPGAAVGAAAVGAAAVGADTLATDALAADALGAADRAAAAPPAPPDSLAGSLRLTLTLAGSLDTSRASPGLSAAAALAGTGLVYGRLGAGALDLSARVRDALRAPDAAVTLGADSLRLGGARFARLDGAYAGGDNAGRFTLSAGSSAGALVAGGGRLDRTPDSTAVTLDSLRVAPRPGAAWTLAGPARLAARSADNTLALDSLALRGLDGSRLALGGTLADTGAVEGRLDVQNASLADLGAVFGATGLVPLLAPPADAPPNAAPAAADSAAGRRLDGRLTATVRLAGTRAEPTINTIVDATAVRVAGARVDRINGDARYQAGRVSATLGVEQGRARVLDARASAPVDLALVPVADRLGTEPLVATVRADSLELALLAAAVPTVRDARGRVAAAMDLSGTWRRPRLDGRLLLTNGAATLDAAGVRLEDAAADVALAGDSVVVRRLAVRSGGPADTLAVTGLVRLTEFGNPSLGLRIAARNFLAVDRPRLATLWVSTPEPLAVTGTYRAATVAGAVRAERGRVFIPELIDKRVVDLGEYLDLIDTTAFADRRLLPRAPAAFVENLALSGVRLSVGNDVWLRSPETNIKLGGSLAVTRARAAGRARAELALLGNLNVERGTYRLDLLPLAQPTFDVQPGTLRFYGTPDFNPALDVRAVHVVRQNRPGTNRPDVRVQVSIGGTLEQPTLQLSSADNPPIPDTDLISYLVTGEPAAAIFGQAQASDQLAAATTIISRLAGSLVSGALSSGRGPFDVVQIETGAASASDRTATGANSPFASILGSTRLGVGGRLGPRTFYTFSTGFCSFTGNADPTASAFSNFTRGLAVKLEQRVTSTFSLQVGVEPALQQQACLAGAASRFLQQTPSQRSFDFTKQWSF